MSIYDPYNQYSTDVVYISSLSAVGSKDGQVIAFDGKTGRWKPTTFAPPINTATIKNFSGGSTSLLFTETTLVSAKKITVMFDRVTTNGQNSLTIQLGSRGSLKYGGYNCTSLAGSAEAGNVKLAYDGFVISGAVSGVPASGLMNFATMGNNIWVGSGSFTASMMSIAAGSVTLNGPIDRIKIGTVGDASKIYRGAVNIMWEY